MSPVYAKSKSIVTESSPSPSLVLPSAMVLVQDTAILMWCSKLNKNIVVNFLNNVNLLIVIMIISNSEMQQYINCNKFKQFAYCCI